MSDAGTRFSLDGCQALSSSLGTTSHPSPMWEAFSAFARMRVSKQIASWCLGVRMFLKLRARSKNTSLLRRRRAWLLAFKPLEKVRHVDPEDLSDDVESARCNPIEAGLILVGLLVGYPDQVGHLLLREAVHDTSLAQTCPDMPIDILGSWSTRPKTSAPIAYFCLHSRALPRSIAHLFRAGG